MKTHIIQRLPWMPPSNHPSEIMAASSVPEKKGPETRRDPQYQKPEDISNNRNQTRRNFQYLGTI